MELNCFCGIIKGIESKFFVFLRQYSLMLLIMCDAEVMFALETPLRRSHERGFGRGRSTPLSVCLFALLFQEQRAVMTEMSVYVKPACLRKQI